jgi:2-polyprenyl-3-methyl-5-hydroxy-6-metoxy-1,4-benzoquinol methylase
MLRGNRILDLGCGYGHWGHLIKTHYTALRSEPVSVVGVDIFDGNVEFCRGLGVYDDVVKADVVQYLATLAAFSCDTIVAVELIEHFAREDGTRMLDEIDRIQPQIAIISTPNFPAFRGGGDTMGGFNEWEHHLSHWTTADFRTRGYEVLGISSKLHKTVPGMYRVFRAFPALKALAGGLSERMPIISLNLLAIKHFGKARPHKLVFDF